MMFYQLRLKDGSSAEASKGTFVDPTGTSTVLRRDDVQPTVIDRRTSPDSSANDPIRWRMVVPKY